MTQHELARVAVRLIAVVIFAFAAYMAATAVITTIDSLVRIARGLGGTGEFGIIMIASALPAILLAAIGAVVWITSGHIAHRIVGPNNNAHSISHIDERTLLGIGCSLIGLWLTIMSLMGAAMLLVMTPAGSSAHGLVASRGGIAALLLQESLRLFVGLYLLLGARGLIDLIHRARRFGQHEDNAPPAHPPQ